MFPGATELGVVDMFVCRGCEVGASGQGPGTLHEPRHGTAGISYISLLQ